MLKKLIILLFAIAPLALVAQESKIAYVNSQELFGLMPELGAIETQMTTKQELVKKNAPVQEKLQKAIKAVGEEKGFTYILDISSGSVAFHSTTAIDASPLVKAKLGILK